MTRKAIGYTKARRYSVKRNRSVGKTAATRKCRRTMKGGDWSFKKMVNNTLFKFNIFTKFRKQYPNGVITELTIDNQPLKYCYIDWTASNNSSHKNMKYDPVATYNYTGINLLLATKNLIAKPNTINIDALPPFIKRLYDLNILGFLYNDGGFKPNNQLPPNQSANQPNNFGLKIWYNQASTGIDFSDTKDLRRNIKILLYAEGNTQPVIQSA